MIKLTPTVAASLVMQSPDSEKEHGDRATFISLKNGWGLKFYEKKDTRDRTHRLQKKAAKYGLAPEIGSRVSFKTNGQTYYGYSTATAEVVCRKWMSEHGVTQESLDSDGDISDAAEDFHVRMKNSTEYRSLMRGLGAINLATYDMHWGNVGYLENGSFVAIDFDHC